MPSRFRLCASAHGCASVRPSRALMRQRVASARGATRVSRDSISCVRHSNADLAIGRKGRSSYEERVRHSVCHWGKNCPPLLRARFLVFPPTMLLPAGQWPRGRECDVRVRVREWRERRHTEWKRILSSDTRTCCPTKGSIHRKDRAPVIVIHRHGLDHGRSLELALGRQPPELRGRKRSLTKKMAARAARCSNTCIEPGDTTPTFYKGP